MDQTIPGSETEGGQPPSVDPQTTPMQEGAQPPAEAPAVPSDPTAGLTLDDLDAYLETGTLPNQQPTDEQQAQNPEPQETPPTTETPEEQPAPEQSAKEPPDRIRLSGVPDNEKEKFAAARALIASGTVGTLAEAVAMIEQRQGAKQEQPPPEQQPKPQAEANDPVAILEAEITALQEKQETLLQEFDNAGAIKLANDIAEKKLDLREAKREATSRQAQAAEQAKQAQAWEQQENTAREQVLKMHPELTDPSSAFFDEFSLLRDAAEMRNDPILSTPDWPLKMAEKVQARLAGRTPAQQVQKPAQPQPQAKPGVVPAQQPAKPSRPIGSVATPSSASTTITPDEVLKRVSSLDLDSLDKALASTDPRAALGFA